VYLSYGDEQFGLPLFQLDRAGLITKGGRPACLCRPPGGWLSLPPPSQPPPSSAIAPGPAVVRQWYCRFVLPSTSPLRGPARCALPPPPTRRLADSIALLMCDRSEAVVYGVWAAQAKVGLRAELLQRWCCIGLSPA
jgi:hypothetical protein